MTSSSSEQRRPSTSPLAPPSGPLPALPVAKTRVARKALPILPSNASESRPGPSGSTTSTVHASRPPMRSVTTSGLPTRTPPKSRSTPAVPTLRTTEAFPEDLTQSLSASSGIPTPGKTLRKTTSIGAFPLPPKGNPRVSSLPPSPLSTSTSLSDVNGAVSQNKRRDSSKHRSAEGGVKKLKSRSSGYGVRTRQSASGVSSSPSLLNGTGDSNLVSSANGSIGSDGLLNPPSPPHSRSSSANGSYMTDGTAFEDVGEDLPERGRPKSEEATTGSKRESGGKDTKGNVVVSVRVRPDASSGDGSRADGEWMVDGRRSLIAYNGREGGDYRFDNVFSPHDQNSRVYDNSAKRLVRRVMEGYHGTVFAYGMTGTGKTFSMQGTANSPGVIPLAITDIFSYIRENPNREFLLRVSYLEIYNEKIYDLLSQGAAGQQAQEEIKLREDAKRGVYATPLKEEIVQSPNQLLRVIARGDLARRTSSTQFNARSSRSHAVVQIVVESRARASPYSVNEGRRSDRIAPEGVLVSTLSLIDLAGSERAAESKERRTEGAHINKSLLTLGTVIGRLHGEDDKEDGAKSTEKAKHLPYRDSKLTRLLQPALSGDSLVSILCTIQLSAAGTSAAQSSTHTGETLNTLKFASRAKNNIVSHAKRNESNPNSGDPGSRALLDRYRLEIQDLRAQLDQQTKAKDDAEKAEEMEKDRQMEEELERQERTRHEEQMLEMQLARTALKERISHLNRLILSSKSLGVNSGRFSSMSVPQDRGSVYSVNEALRPTSIRSRESMNHTHARDSAATLEAPVDDPSMIGRAVSSGSITMGVLPAAHVSHMMLEEEGEDEDEDEEANQSGDREIDVDGDASLAQQNRMLQADLADKNRYIATLEKRLLQARRTSHSRTSMHLASRSSLLPSEDPGSLENVVREKDREIEELRAKLDDQMRMVTALRSVARKRDMLEKRKSPLSSSSAMGGDESTPAVTRPSTAHAAFSRADSRASTRSNTATAAPTRPPISTTSSASRHSGQGQGHRSSPSTVSRSSSTPGVVNFSKTLLSPMAILSSDATLNPSTTNNSTSPPGTAVSNNPPPHAYTSDHTNSLTKDAGIITNGEGQETRPTASRLNSSSPSKSKALRRKSVDEMTMLLDQMIQERVESGQVVHGERPGSLRVKRDTVMEGKEAIGANAVGGAVVEEE